MLSTIFPRAAQAAGLSKRGNIVQNFLGGGLGAPFFTKKGAPSNPQQEVAHDLIHQAGLR